MKWTVCIRACAGRCQVRGEPVTYQVIGEGNTGISNHGRPLDGAELAADTTGLTLVRRPHTADNMASFPRHKAVLATRAAQTGKLIMMEFPPNTEPRIIESIFWHPRDETDAAIGWLRDAVKRTVPVLFEAFDQPSASRVLRMEQPTATLSNSELPAKGMTGRGWEAPVAGRRIGYVRVSTLDLTERVPELKVPRHSVTARMTH